MNQSEKTQPKPRLDLRCRGDFHLFGALSQDPLVQKVNQQLQERAEAGPSGIRRKLLATSLRISPAMSAPLHKMMAECKAALGIAIPVEMYVFPSPSFNAMCVKPEEGRLFIMFSSSLLEAFEGSALKFVVGHELGHHLFGHHDIPIGYIMQGKEAPPASLALRLFAWSRYAEISADRAGAVCAADQEGSAQSMFRLASGLRSDVLALRIDDFAEQAEAMELEGEKLRHSVDPAQWFSTHPYSPLRLRALRAFFQTKQYGDGGVQSLEWLEAQVQALMTLMEPSYLAEKSDEAETMRRLLFAAAIQVALVDGEKHEKEHEVFERFFGEGSWDEDLNTQSLIEAVEKRTQDVKAQLSPEKHLQIIKDIAVIARADGDTSEEERGVIRKIASQLEVDAQVVDAIIDAQLSPD